MLLGQFPVCKQFIAMKLVPFHHRFQCPPRETTLDDTGGDFNCNVLLTIPRMKMRRPVIVIKHVDHDAKEPTDLRHESSPS
jgi:hypothetical protein